MMMNVSANLLGLDNAATPLGLNAMRELQTLNRRPDVATDAQIMFIVLNTAGLTLIPTSVIAIRQAIAVKQGLVGFNAADIFLPTLLATGAHAWRGCWRWPGCSGSTCCGRPCWWRSGWSRRCWEACSPGCATPRRSRSAA